MSFVYAGEKAEEVNGVLAALIAAFHRHLGANLKGLYLHGSMAMGCFRPWSSDIDLLAVVQEPMVRQNKLELVDAVMAITEGGSEFRKVEFSVVTAVEAARAVHPIQYILHYSDGWHQAYKEGRAELVIAGGEDEDLTAHFMVAWHRGHTLAGIPIHDALGEVSKVDYRKAVWYDIAGSAQAVERNPAYTVLNLCRTLMYLETGQIGSKLEGGLWAARQQAMAPYSGAIAEAIGEYTTGQSGRFSMEMLHGFVCYALGQVNPSNE